jgi:chromosomal replication initiator protein
MAYAAAQAVSRNPGQAYHLLYLFGGVGVGKTHLMHAIGHRILEKNPDTKMLCKTGEEFTNEIVEAIRDKSTTEFHKRYRAVTVLLIDDIQFIGGKDKVQEEFFHTFNAIHQEGGQIVLTSDQMPSDIAGLEARLRSRFEGGLTIDIQQPSFELRAAILLIKAKAWHIDVPMDVAQLVAANIESTRQLEGFLKRLVAETTFKHEPIAAETAERILGSMKHHDSGNGVVKKTLEPTTILKTVAEVFTVKLSALKGERRKREIVTPRHLAMYLMRTDAGLPFDQVGAFFGGRDHTTIMHAVEKMTAALPNDARLRGSLAEVRKRIDTAFPQSVENSVD